jgi:hypothetical protein
MQRFARFFVQIQIGYKGMGVRVCKIPHTLNSEPLKAFFDVLVYTKNN